MPRFAASTTQRPDDVLELDDVTVRVDWTAGWFEHPPCGVHAPADCDELTGRRQLLAEGPGLLVYPSDMLLEKAIHYIEIGAEAQFPEEDVPDHVVIAEAVRRITSPEPHLIRAEPQVVSKAAAMLIKNPSWTRRRALAHVRRRLGAEWIEERNAVLRETASKPTCRVHDRARHGRVGARIRCPRGRRAASASRGSPGRKQDDPEPPQLGRHLPAGGAG